MHNQGVRGVRLNFVKGLDENESFEEVALVAAKIRERGWHIVVHFEPSDLPDFEDFLTNLDIPLVVDHLGHPEDHRGIARTCPLGHRLAAPQPEISYARDAILLTYLTQIVPEQTAQQRLLVDKPMKLYWDN